MIGLEISTLFFIDRVDSFKKKKKRRSRSQRFNIDWLVDTREKKGSYLCIEIRGIPDATII